MNGTGEKVVVIGAGMGGLAAAIRLASAGRQVILIEAAARPGGKMRTVPSDIGPVDAGPTVLTLRHVFDDLFASAGDCLDDHLTLLAQPLLARHWWPDGSRLDLFSDPGASADAIAAFAGAREAAAFLRFNAATAALYDAFERPVMLAPAPHMAGILRAAITTPRLWPALLPGVSLARFIALYFRDPRLRQLFGRYATYVGGTPARSPAVLSLIWQAEARGVWAVKGGMHALATALADLARRKGVECRFGTSALRILRQGGRVSGVQLADGHTVVCDSVIYNGDPAALTMGLLGDAAQSALPPSATAPRSLSAQVWSFAATACGPVAADLAHHNVFFATNPDQEFGPLQRGQMPGDPTIYICAEDRTASHLPGAAERFEIILNAPPVQNKPVPAKPVQNKPLQIKPLNDTPQTPTPVPPGCAPDPKEAHLCRIKTFHRLTQFGLTFTPEPDAASLTTPHLLAQMYPGSQGAIYGRSPHGALASFQRPGARTALPGLYLAGGGCHPGAGVPMAAMSGKHAAEAMLGDLALMSGSIPTAMPGGMSMASRMMGRARYRS